MTLEELNKLEDDYNNRSLGGENWADVSIDTLFELIAMAKAADMYQAALEMIIRDVPKGGETNIHKRYKKVAELVLFRSQKMVGEM